MRDLVRQRRRWMEGLLHLAFNRRLPLVPKLPLLYSIFTWTLAPFQLTGNTQPIGTMTLGGSTRQASVRQAVSVTGTGPLSSEIVDGSNTNSFLAYDLIGRQRLRFGQSHSDLGHRAGRSAQFLRPPRHNCEREQE